jgi:hypothetical protein
MRPTPAVKANYGFRLACLDSMEAEDMIGLDTPTRGGIIILVGCDTQECLEIRGIGKAAEEAGVERIVDTKREKDLIKIPIRHAK